MSKSKKLKLMIASTILGVIMAVGGEFLPKGAFDFSFGADKGVKAPMNMIQLIGLMLFVGPWLASAAKWYFIDRKKEILAAEVAKRRPKLR